MRAKLFFLASALLSSTTFASTTVSTCKGDIRSVVVDDQIVRVEIPMTPFRGINLIFPFDIKDEKALYNISSDRVFDFHKSNNTNLVPLYIKAFETAWFGTSADFTIAYDDFVFSFLITAAPEGHCSNYRISLSQDLLKRMEAQKAARNAAMAGSLGNVTQEYIEDEVTKQLLNRIAAIVKGDHKKIRVHEEGELKTSSDDRVVLYLKNIEKFDTFSIITAEVENKSGTVPLMIKSFMISGQSSAERMHSKFQPKMEPGTKQAITITLLGDLPKTGGTLLMATNHGNVEVEW